MSQFLKTPAVARQTGINYWTIMNALRDGRVAPPAKDSSGDFVWTKADIARLVKALKPKQPAQVG